MRRCDTCGSLNSSLDEGDLCNIYNGVPCATCEQLSLLNLQIAEATDHMEKLLHERRRMKSERNRDHDILNACLPPEIMARIFELYVAPTSEPNHSKRVPSSPMILVAVCQAWRDLAERTPSLWVSVRINLTKDTKDANLQTLTRHIRCSGSHHLFIQIRLLEDETRTNTDTGAIYAAFLDTLSTCSKRWQVLDCDITKEFWERLRLCLCAGADPIEAPGIVAPFLQTLRLYSLRGDILTEEDVFSRGLSDITAVPQFNPTHVSLECIAPPFIDINWTNVQKLSVRNIRLEDALDLLGTTEQMTDCAFHMHEKWFYAIPREQKMHLMITSLDIGFEGQKGVTIFFDLVTLPSLQRLAINLCTHTLPPYSFEQFLKRSACPLQVLSLDGVRSTSDLVDILKTTPLLQKLAMISHPYDQPKYGYNDVLVYLLKARLDSIKFLPVLEVLLIRTRDINWDAVADLCLAIHGDEASGPPNVVQKPLSCIKIVDYYTQNGPLASFEQEKIGLLSESRDKQGMVKEFYIRPFDDDNQIRRQMDLMSGAQIEILEEHGRPYQDFRVSYDDPFNF